MKFATRYNPPADAGVSPEGVSLTQQEYKADCDVNNMIRRAISGDLSVLRHPNYCNVLGAPTDAHEVANRLAQANTIWHDMPDKVRATYGSPEAFLRYLDECAAKDAANLEASRAADAARQSAATDVGKKAAFNAATVSGVNTPESSTDDAHA